MLKALMIILLIILLVLQYRLWVGDGSLAHVRYLKDRLEQQQLENSRLKERNQGLQGEVNDLKSGLDAIEERARSEMGMIGRDETFYMVIKKQHHKKSAEQ